MFQEEIDEFFNDIPNVYGIAGDNIIAGFDAESRDHIVILDQVLQNCRQAYLKLNKEKWLCR